MRLSTRIILGFLLVLVLSIIDTTFNYLLSLKVERNIRFLNKSQDIIRNSGNLQRTVIDMQSSLRGYLLTEDSSFLDGYLQGLQKIPPLFVDQRNLVIQNKEQVTILDSIENLHKRWFGFADELIDARKQSNTSDNRYTTLFENRVRKQVGKKLNAKIAAGFADFDKIEYAVRTIHSDNLRLSIRRTHIFSLIFFSLTIIIGIATTFYIVSLISKRIKKMVNLAESISNGKFLTVSDSRKDELTSLTTSLNRMSINLQKNINELENRNAELDKFAYVVSHDLKAPIRGIHNVINWIEEDMSNELSPQLSKYVNIISGRTRRMESLINGLLDYARIREKTAFENVDVNKLVTEIVEDIVPRNFKLELKDLPVIFAERLRLEQVFTNLISNAVNYTSREDGHITISCKKLEEYYEFSVRDNGIGIEPEFHEKIFDIFQTLREKGENESTGIGLAIIKKIIDEQKGRIIVNSQLGSGTEFIFTWPRINKSI